MDPSISQIIPTDLQSKRSSSGSRNCKWYAYRANYLAIKRIVDFVEQCNDGKSEEEKSVAFIPTRMVERFDKEGVRSYEERAIIPSLLFVRSDDDIVLKICRNPLFKASVYKYPGSSEPAPIDDRVMEIFMMVLTRGRDLEAIDLSLAKGTRVRVTDGIFKGAEGYVARIKNAKRFIVKVEGVAAVATTYIPRQFLEKI